MRAGLTRKVREAVAELKGERELMGARFTLANRNHLGLFCRILLMNGALCPRCGHSTRRTSKHWGRCKKCDERVPRRTVEEVLELLE